MKLASNAVFSESYGLSLEEKWEYLASAREFAGKARELILGYWKRGSFEQEEKEDQSLVTTADIQAELLLRELINERYPRHGIIGEEFEQFNPHSEFQWTIDPIDGTQNFAAGIPTFGTLLSLRHQGRAIIGLIDHPALKRTTSGGAGLGVFLNEKRISLKDVTKSKLGVNDIVALGLRKNFARSGQEHIYDRLTSSCQSIRTYYDCFADSLTIQGSVAVSVNANIKLWDISPTEALIPEVGGVFKYFGIQKVEGKPQYYSAVYGIPYAVGCITSLLK